jgi:hypothetical protein
MIKSFFFYKKQNPKDYGIFTIFMAASVFALFGLMTLGIDTFILLQSKMDLNIAAQQAAHGAIRYLTDPNLWPAGENPTTTKAQTKMKKLVAISYVVGKGQVTMDEDFSIDAIETGTYTNNVVIEGSKHVVKGVFTSQTDPGTPEARKLVGDENTHYAVKIRLGTNNSGAKIAGVFTRIYNADGYEVSATAIAYYDKNIFGASPYAIAQ